MSAGKDYYYIKTSHKKKLATVLQSYTHNFLINI
jgi:hypothetical protein